MSIIQPKTICFRTPEWIYNVFLPNQSYNILSFPFFLFTSFLICLYNQKENIYMYHIKRQMNAKKYMYMSKQKTLCYIYSVIHKICEFSICVQCIQTKKKPKKQSYLFIRKWFTCIHSYVYLKLKIYNGSLACLMLWDAICAGPSTA